ncbi:MAG TPA: peptidase [Pseudomonas xinjiangensis]|uniref:Peptidase n=2 Tax=root TaxID=1 RepID=A0A7V1BQ71_9GAMM|nr:peptidase [Halopseudomonas xinjiangensis]HEC48830.1 peptidase [Halopseudomonas xinjiangensis]
MRCALLGALFCWPAFTYAGRDIGQDEALRLVEQGTIESLNVLIADALERFPGRFLQAELELDDGRYIYEIEIVTQERRVMELEYDAATRELLDVDEDD